MKRVIFVGMHNKPGMLPLDSRTKTGKVVDRIIAELGPGVECVKTNLVDGEVLPTERSEIMECCDRWLQEYIVLEKEAVVVLLGAWARNHFPYSRLRQVHLKHPAAVFSKLDAYVDRAYADIANALLPGSWDNPKSKGRPYVVLTIPARARKPYECMAGAVIKAHLEDLIQTAGLTRDEYDTITELVENDWMIMPGQLYERRNTVDEGPPRRLYTFLCLPQIDAICVKYNLYSNE